MVLFNAVKNYVQWHSFLVQLIMLDFRLEKKLKFVYDL